MMSTMLGSKAGTGGLGACLLRSFSAASTWQTLGVTAEGRQSSASVTSTNGTLSVGTQPGSTSPVTYFLTSLIGCSQAALASAAAERQISLGKVRWKAKASVDTSSSSEPATGFRSIELTAEVPTVLQQIELVRLGKEVEGRSIIASTLQRSGVDFQLQLQGPAAVFKSSMGTWIDDAHKTSVLQKVKEARERLPAQRAL